MKLSARVIARARKVTLLATDVDGVMTDGRMFIGDGGDEVKAFHTRDGIGFNLARLAGLKLAMITGETSTIAKARGTKLGADSIVLGARRKGDVLEALAAEHGIALGAIAYVGDDLLDLPALQRAGLAIAVGDAVAEVKAAAHVVTRATGGHGAIREVVELILRSQGVWQQTVERFARDHGALRGPR